MKCELRGVEMVEGTKKHLVMVADSCHGNQMDSHYQHFYF